MEKSTQNATVLATSPEAAKTAAVNPETTPRKRTKVPWKTFYQGFDFVRLPNGKPEEVVVKGPDGQTAGTGRYKVKQNYAIGDTIVDGNGDSFLVMPDMSLRAITKFKRREARQQRHAERKEDRQARRAAERQQASSACPS